MIPMMNTYDTIRAGLQFNKFAVGELLFVEYKCPIEQDVAGVWTPMDYSCAERQKNVAHHGRDLDG